MPPDRYCPYNYFVLNYVMNFERHVEERDISINSSDIKYIRDFSYRRNDALKVSVIQTTFTDWLSLED
jgi:hypothetical protein